MPKLTISKISSTSSDANEKSLASYVKRVRRINPTFAAGFSSSKANDTPTFGRPSKVSKPKKILRFLSPSAAKKETEEQMIAHKKMAELEK